MTTPPFVLTIAGSDSGGGAGIQADLKTFAALNTYGASVITALTAQNTQTVAAISAPEPEFVTKQLEVVLDDLDIDAAKTGMLFSSGVIEAVTPLLKSATFPLVVDPVCVAQSGAVLLQEDAVEALKRDIIPLSTLLTPNRNEAELLSGVTIDGPEAVERAGKTLVDMGAKAVLVKGGHMRGDRSVIDWLFTDKGESIPLEHELIQTTNLHGTGCTLSAAIAAYMAKGEALQPAVEKAQAFLLAAMKAAFPVGKGDGPVNHLITVSQDGCL